MPALQRGAAWAEERHLGALRQSVPQNGRVHLHIIEIIRKSSSRVTVISKWIRVEFFRVGNVFVAHGMCLFLPDRLLPTAPAQKWDARQKFLAAPGSTHEPSGPLQHSKRPRTPDLSKICPEDCFFPGSNQGGPNLSKICRMCEKKRRQFPDKFSNFRQIFDQFGSPWSEPEKKQSSGQIFDKNFGVRGFFVNAVRGRRARRAHTENLYVLALFKTQLTETLCWVPVWALKCRFWSFRSFL